MKQHHTRALTPAVIGLALMLFGLANPLLATDLAGRWSGQINTPGMALRIGVNFSPPQADAAPAGDWTGTIDIPQQGAKGLPLADIEVEGDRVAFKIANIPGDPAFSGVIAPDGQSIKGDFKQGGLNTTFSLDRGELRKIRRPQDPVPPFPYHVEEISIPVGSPDAQGEDGTPKGFFLSGTITKPDGDGPFPSVILISGSGPQNRDQELMDHRPFAVIADHLTRAGILVLRYDDRGTAKSGGTYAGSTMKDFADDAEACLRHLRGRADVGPVGLIGHSEGGRVAPMLAARDRDVRFLVLLAGPGVPGHELMARQNELIVLASGATPEAAAEVRAAAAALFAAVNDDAPRDRQMELLRNLVEAQIIAVGQSVPEDEQQRAALEETLTQQAENMQSPWFRHFLIDDPRPDLARVQVPVLALNGVLDVQVDPDQNLSAIAEALKQGGNTDTTTLRLPGLNHLFQFVPNGSVALYATTPETFNPSALNAIRDWILERFPAPASE
ncbi:MAG: alpha/beta fold hydrolase [Phycisphaeraceae bacterium]|nr:alpha/beta fold hydrolase [Phycisphaeraceae bacterium]